MDGVIWGRVIIPILATAIFMSFAYTTKSIWRVEAASESQQEQVVQQIQETKEDIEARLQRMEWRNEKRQDTVMEYLKELKEDIKNGR